MNDTNPDIHRGKPNDLEAERVILAALMLDSAAISEVLSLKDADFYDSRHAILFRTVANLIDRNAPADPLIIADELSKQGTLDKIGGIAFVTSIYDSAISAANIRHYVEIVKEKAVRRNIITQAFRLMQSAYDPTVDAQQALNNAQEGILAISLEKEEDTLQPAAALAKKTFAGIEERHLAGGRQITGLSSGLTAVDSITAGFNAGDLVIIAGRPGMGKSALAMNIASHVSLNETTAAFFSLEMPSEPLMIRVMAGLSGIDSRRLRQGTMSPLDWSSLVTVATELSYSKLFIDEKSSLTPMQLRARARRLKAQHDLGLVIVDYIQLMKVPGRHETREREIAEISSSLKALAKELNIPVIALSQLNRKVEERTNRRPQMADLRESGAIEQDADIIAFIYRDEVYNKSDDNPEKGLADIIVEKNRNGVTGMAKVKFDPATQTFKDK